MPGEVPKPLFTLMCEDAREEAFGRLSLLGVYSEQVLFKERPMQLRLLSFYTRFSGGKGSFALWARLEGPKGEVFVKTKIGDPKFPASAESQFTNLALGFGQISFEHEGEYRFEVYLDDATQPIIQHPFSVHLRPEVFTSSS